MSRTGAPSIYGSTELRLIIAAVVGAGALALAGLAAFGRRSEFMLLDFRTWRPVSSLPGPVTRTVFEALQTPAPDQRPLRLALQAPPGGFMAAEHSYPGRAGRRYCVRTLLFASAESAPQASMTEVRLLVNGRVVAARPLAELTAGTAFWAGGIQPRRGRVALRLEVRASGHRPAATTGDAAPAIAYFEHATLRECGP